MRSTIPLYWGERGDPNRRVVGSAEVDTESGEILMTVTEDQAQESLKMTAHMNLRAVLSDSLPPHTVLAPGATLSVEPTDEDILDAQIERLHGPGAVEALNIAIADGSIFSESSR